MGRRMRFVSRLMLLSLAGLIACAGALGPSKYINIPGGKGPESQEPERTPISFAPRRASLPSRDQVYGQGPHQFNHNSQGPLYRGGALEKFQYFFAPGGKLPPEELTSATGHHAMLGDVEVELIRDTKNDNTCVTSGPVFVYDVRVQTSDQGKINPCAGESYTRSTDDTCTDMSKLDGRAIAVPGAWDSTTGNYYETIADKRVFTLACMTGIASKCVNWGYPPWGVHKGEPLSAYYAACIHAARAEYASSLLVPSYTSYTCQGTKIDVYDRLNIQHPTITATQELFLEGSWGKDGPKCLTQDPRFQACKDEMKSINSTVSTCVESELLWNENAYKQNWPEGVLLMTWSAANNVATSACSVPCAP